MIKHSSGTATAFNFGRQYPVIEETINRFKLEKSSYEEYEKQIQKFNFTYTSPTKYNQLLSSYLKEVLSDVCKLLQGKANRKKFSTQKISSIKRDISNIKTELNDIQNDLESLYDIKERVFQVDDDLKEIKRIDKVHWIFFFLGIIIGFILGWIKELVIG